jgi:PAS domain S-box-containing protein
MGISISTLNEGRYLDVNEAFVKMYGFANKEELIGQTDSTLQTWAQIEDRSAMIKRVRTGQSKIPFNYPFRHQSGEFREAVTVADIIELNGEEFIMSMVQDVTRQKQAEAELELYRQHLEDLVKMRTTELDELTEKLRAEVIERQIAETAEREQRIMAEGLRNIAVALNTQVNLDAVVEEVILNVGRIVSHDALQLMLVEDGVVRSVSAAGVVELPILNNILNTQETLLIPDMDKHSTWLPAPQHHSIRSYLGIPLISHNEVIGYISLGSKTPNHFIPEHLSRLTMFAEQAAVAIQNARLYQQIGEVAAWRERQRISRELHDAVTQTMFSANIIAETLLRLWNSEPDKVPAGLQQLQHLTRSAVAEARNLLFELRPDAMEDVNLSRLIKQLAAAFEGRTGITPTLNISDSIPISRSTKSTLYWIAHEALNNIAKHAQASITNVSLALRGNLVYFVISDDGQGFDTTEPVSGQLGLKIMRERAASINATLDVVSRTNHGTTIWVAWESETL